jgi:3-oxoacyl-[acyl-carrier-protein] synthase-1
MAGQVLIVGCGMMTPVGLSTAETAASTRSRTARLTDIEWRDSRFQRFTVAVVPDDGLPELNPELATPPLTYREERMLRLAGPAVQQAMAPLARHAGRIPAVVALPELHTTIPIREADFLRRLAVQSGAKLDPGSSVALPRGRAAGLSALREAVALIEGGRARFVLVGGVDTYVDLYVLGTLDLQKRVRTEVNADGFAPGEGAGFVLLASAEATRELRLQALAAVLASGTSAEPGHLYSETSYTAEALAAAFQSAFAAAPGLPPAATLYASFNGERYWAKEFGVAVVRNKERIAAEYQIEHPAECFGDLGAAHGAVLLGLAAFRAKQTCPAGPALVFSSSDYGERAAVLLGLAAET